MNPRRFARNESYERSCFWLITTREHPKKVVVVAVLDHISWATARVGPSKYVGGLMGTVDVVVLMAVVHHISWAAVRAGPSEHIWAASWAGRRGPHGACISWAAAWPSPPIFERMGRGPARSINFSGDGPRPSPAHQNFRGWAAARPSPLHFQIFAARPGPASQIFKSLGPVRPGPLQFSAQPGRARTSHMTHHKPSKNEKRHDEVK